MKAIWNGSLTFGLINIPVKVYPASEEHALAFHMLHKKDLSPIHFARICKEEEKEIPYSEIVKGYEYEKGKFVVIDDKDFRQANAKKTSSIEIQQFTHLHHIDPIYYEKPYYLEPDKKSGKAFALLQEALNTSKKAAVVNFVFRNKEHIGIILAKDNGLVLIQMRYFAEIRTQEDLSIIKQKVNPKELKMALGLIEQSTKPFHPEDYHDTYTEELMGVIEQKLKGKKKKRTSEKTKSSPQSTDLMDLLQKSLKKTFPQTPTHLLSSKKKSARRKLG